ncbi:unnamed protein product [Clonostachys rhizophaga]|uniref:Uncharacterized protein n=1 Tax=Clonostachys rhizophaga TaxID=160324 RepID=A0A9N9W626_9HYPO|nr:unnamed protein product [Clonostachys rhizophaga]
MSAYSVIVLKDFVYMPIKGTKNLEACVQTVRNYWNIFTGAWKMLHEPSSSGSIGTVTHPDIY